MRVNGKAYRTIGLATDGKSVEFIDQALLPHKFATQKLRDLEDAVRGLRGVGQRVARAGPGSPVEGL